MTKEEQKLILDFFSFLFSNYRLVTIADHPYPSDITLIKEELNKYMIQKNLSND